MDQFNNLCIDKMKVSVFPRRDSICRLPEQEINKMTEVLTDVSSFADNSKNDMVVNFIFPNFYIHPDDAKKIKRSIEEMDGCLVHSSSELLVLEAKGGWRVSVHLGGSLKGFGTSSPGIGVLDGSFAEANRELVFDELNNSTTSSSLMDSNDSLPGPDNLTQDIHF